MEDSARPPIIVCPSTTGSSISAERYTCSLFVTNAVLELGVAVEINGHCSSFARRPVRELWSGWPGTGLCRWRRAHHRLRG